MRENEYGQPVGDPVAWTPPVPIGPVTLVGEHCRLEPWSAAHLDDLYDATVRRSPASNWTYLAIRDHDRPAALGGWLDSWAADPAAQPMVVLTPSGRAVGSASFLRCDPANGVVEVGAIIYAAELQRTTAATEAMHLMMRHAFDLGYRRYEWKCDHLNAPSRAAALRLGFRFEGTFRQAVVHLGERNRDTDWFAVIDEDWPTVRAEHERWLAPGNFDDAGDQRTPLRVPAGPA